MSPSLQPTNWPRRPLIGRLKSSALKHQHSPLTCPQAPPAPQKWWICHQTVVSFLTEGNESTASMPSDQTEQRHLWPFVTWAKKLEQQSSSEGGMVQWILIKPGRNMKMGLVIFRGSFGWGSGRSTLWLLRATLSFTSSWKTGNRAGVSTNTDFTLMVQKATTPFTSRICLEICWTPWATTQAWCSPPRTGTMTTWRTPAVPKTTQVDGGSMLAEMPTWMEDISTWDLSGAQSAGEGFSGDLDKRLLPSSNSPKSLSAQWLPTPSPPRQPPQREVSISERSPVKKNTALNSGPFRTALVVLYVGSHSWKWFWLKGRCFLWASSAVVS